MSVIHIVTPDNEAFYRDEMEQAYRLRHRVFVEEMGWTDLAKPDGREIDQFDNEHAVHMLYIEEGKVLGYQRMLPSTRPHFLSEVMPELCEGERPVGAHIWEWTRFCVARERREKGRAVCPITNMLLSAAVEWGLKCGITRLIIETNPIWLLRMVQLHFRPTPLGLQHTIGGQDVIAIIASFDLRTLSRLRAMRGTPTRTRTIERFAPRPALLRAA
jgi:acyl-homoserine lactone synthase